MVAQVSSDEPDSANNDGSLYFLQEQVRAANIEVFDGVVCLRLTSPPGANDDRMYRCGVAWVTSSNSALRDLSGDMATGLYHPPSWS
uniref:Uncharacterized protein n=1 Tax=Ditylenchus dipsaci TaxID=166011 RepID=A0A915EUW6_9BILA